MLGLVEIFEQSSKNTLLADGVGFSLHSRYIVMAIAGLVIALVDLLAFSGAWLVGILLVAGLFVGLFAGILFNVIMLPVY